MESSSIYPFVAGLVHGAQCPQGSPTACVRIPCLFQAGLYSSVCTDSVGFAYVPKVMDLEMSSA